MSGPGGRGPQQANDPRRRWRVAAALTGLALSGCTLPAARVDELAVERGMSRAVVRGLDFDHVVFTNHPAAMGRVLHVYVEGDGSPYRDRWTASTDPTPRHPLMLQLMAEDPVASLYVGRPCYFGLARAAPCTPLDWTTGRFSERIVDSMGAVIEREIERSGWTVVEIYGHSGGGALAVLLARRLPKVSRVITLAGNLDTDAWCDLHHYTHLEQSLNPVREGPLPAAVRQRHYVGSRDTVMPQSLVDAAARALGAGSAQVLPGVTHTTGWADHWPAIAAGQ